MAALCSLVVSGGSEISKRSDLMQRKSHCYHSQRPIFMMNAKLSMTSGQVTTR